VEFLILESREGSGYADSASEYEFPRRYLKEFSRVGNTDVVALIYEPKRQNGRRAYVAWAPITGEPIETSPGTFTVRFGEGLMSFNSPVPFVVNGSPVEHRLRSLSPRGYGSALQGRAVRQIPAENALEILAMGMAVGPADYFWNAEGVSAADDSSARQRQIVTRLSRDARFRDAVLKGWGYRCAVSGLTAGPNPASRLSGLVEAAHVRPVGAGGPDVIENGICLSPTVHRLFDAGLFTIRRDGDVLRVATSPQLRPEMVISPNGARLCVVDGAQLLAPAHALSRTSDEFLKFHERSIFLSSA
jgi:putative restriction endonuclease